MKKSISFLGYLKIPYDQYKSVSFLFDLMQINDRIELNYLNGLKNIFYFTF